MEAYATSQQPAHMGYDSRMTKTAPSSQNPSLSERGAELVSKLLVESDAFSEVEFATILLHVRIGFATRTKEKISHIYEEVKRREIDLREFESDRKQMVETLEKVISGVASQL